MKTKTRILVGLIAMLMPLTLLSACKNESESSSDKSTTSTTSQASTTSETSKETEKNATLVTDMSFGSGNISKHQFSYSGTLTVEIMAQGLSELTGLNFAIKESNSANGSISVDWSTESTFIAGLGDIEQKEEFFMFESVSLTWFMLNSMYQTILENNGGNVDVFYSMDGGKPIMNEAFEPDGLPVDIAFTGSSEGRGDIIDDDLNSNFTYVEEFTINGDFGESISPAEAAKLTFDTMKDNGSVAQYSDETQYTMTLVDLKDIKGDECYIYRLDAEGTNSGAAFAYDYQNGKIYMQGQGGEWVQPAFG